MAHIIAYHSFPNGGVHKKLKIHLLIRTGDDQGRQGSGRLAEGVQEEDGAHVDHHCHARKCPEKSRYNRTIVIQNVDHHHCHARK